MTPLPQDLLLLSGSKATGGLKPGEKAEALAWARDWLVDFFSGVGPVLVVAYARPDGQTEEVYYQALAERFDAMGIATRNAPAEGVTPASLRGIGGLFVGGGHTYTLLEKLQKTGSMQVIRDAVDGGLRYAGSSAGTLITCPSTKSGNDMAGPANDVIDTRALGLLRFQINCHYMDQGMENPGHMGETRDTRLREVTTFNPDMRVLGLYEGQAIRVVGGRIWLWTSANARGFRSPVFYRGQVTYPYVGQIGVPVDISSL